jgi:ceramide glucosyltransferase
VIPVALKGLQGLFLFALGAHIAYTFITLWAVKQWKLSRMPLNPEFSPGVTVLKPVRGIESAHAYDCFVSFCKQQYPSEKLQIVFGCLDAEDPVIPLIRKLMAEFPDTDIELVISGPESLIGPNRKVCNLIAMLPRAKHALLALCDSDMLVEQDYIRRITAPFEKGVSPAGGQDRGVGLVTCPYRGSRPESLPAVLEGLGIGAEFIPSSMVSRQLEGVGFAFGSTIVIPKEILAEIGGFERILPELADDFRMGEAVRKAGCEVVLSDYVVDDVLGPEKFKPMWGRRLRWARTVRSCRPAGYAGMVVTFGTALALGFALASGFNTIGKCVLAAMVAFRLITAAANSFVTGDRLVRRYLYWLPISDLLSFGLYIASYLGSTIVWRGETFKLLPGGKMVKVESGR